jgi:two-component system, chemotaxis family, CheB/CheR fusion protein
MGIKKIEKFPIICIGASAGGLEAITELLKNLPPDTGMAFIYVQHLSPDHDSILSSILSKSTKMRIREVKNLMPIEPNNFYVIPPAKEMRVLDGKLGLTPRKKDHMHNMPIDVFFTSLAEKHGDRVIGIILSGAATDGTLGMKSIKVNGGLTFAQDDSAKFPSMPKSAIAENAVDFVLPPKLIAKELAALSQNKYVFDDITQQKNDDIIKDDDPDLKNLLSILYQKAGVDFMHYKSTTIKRRILRRMLLYKIAGLKEYIKLLRKKPEEIKTLVQDLLINVTSFFRDARSFEYVKKTIFPKLMKDKSADHVVRIWVCACSTGEEAYSLAMSALEFLGEKRLNYSIQLFATDISEQAIAKARHGEYTASELNNLTPARIQRFFSKIVGSYRINKNIRDMCIFAPHNVFANPPYSRIDLISCCNLLIYLDNILQKKILSVFHYALNESGYLMLGRSEGISSSSLFSQVNKNHKVFLKKKNTSSRMVIERNLDFSKNQVKNTVKDLQHKKASAVDDVDKVFDGLLLSDYVPASVIINNAMEVTQFRGRTSKYLNPPQGKASLNILKMVHPDLTFELNTTIHKVIKSKQSVKRSGIEMKKEHVTHFMTIQVLPLKGHFDEPFFAVIFTEDVEESESKKGTGKKGQSYADQRIKKLEEQLAQSMTDMQGVFEGQETVNEELQSANEEVVSTNEELQSINEELETSKEEIQSTNEELLTTNQELQIRNEQLSESYAYNEAVLSTIHEPFIILDKNIRVRSANRAFYKKFQTNEKNTEGLYLFDISDKQWDIDRLRELLEDIIPTNSQLHNFQVTNEFEGLGKKTFSLNANRIDQKNAREQLIFLAFEDVTESEIRIKKRTDLFFENIANSAPVMLWVTDADGLVSFVNSRWIEFTGGNEKKDNDRSRRIHPDDTSLFLATYNSALQNQKEYALEFRLQDHSGEYRWISEKAVPKFSTSGVFEGFIGCSIDIDDVKEHEQRKDDFIRMASHELKTPITSIKGYVDLMLTLDLKENTFYKSSLITVNKQVGKLTRLITDLLDMTKIETAAFHLNKEVFEMNAHIFEIIEETKSLFVNHELILHRTDDCELYADKERISQVIINLLTNAAKYSPGGKKIIVTIKCGKAELTVSVQDFGIGISKDDQLKIFERFYRSGEKDRLTFPGFGIGLFIASEIIKLHQGKIWVQSEINIGSVFFFSLPLLNK